MRFLSFATIAILVLTSLVVAPPATAAKEISLTDAVGDVRPLTPLLPAGIASPVTDGIDIKSARLYGESGTNLLLEVVATNLAAESVNPPSVIQWITFAACFKWNGQHYSAMVNLRVPDGGTIYAPILALLPGPCTVDPQVTPVTSKNVPIANLVSLDIPKNTMTITLPRQLLGSLAGIAPPRSGDQIGNLHILSYDKPTSGIRTRYDAAPDAGPHADAMTLAYDTTNLGSLVAHAESNIDRIPCQGRLDSPSYAFEAGGRRGIPISFQNNAGDARDIKFSVETIDGIDWKPRVVPQLTLDPFATGGNTTVTVIIDTPAGTKHKDCAILRVLGSDASDPLNQAEALVSAVAVRAPHPDATKLYMHGNSFARDVCSDESTWLNTLENDPEDVNPKIYLKNCKEPDLITNKPVSLRTLLDVNPNNDLVLNTSATDKQAYVVLRLVSEYAATLARLSVTLITAPIGDVVADPIGEGRVTEPLEVGANDVRIPLTIFFDRDEVATGDPSRILLSQEGLGMSIRFEPLPPESTLEEARLAGRVHLEPKGTHLELPIWSTIKRNAADPGASGSLLTIKAANELPRFAAPGRARLLNFTVLNEGPDADTAVMNVDFTGAHGWTAVVLPQSQFPILAGQKMAVQVAVSPPATANESESVVVDIVVSSEKDKTARASVATRMIATREAGVPEDLVPTVLANKKGGLPAPGLFEALALVGLVAVVLVRRRR